MAPLLISFALVASGCSISYIIAMLQCGAFPSVAFIGPAASLIASSAAFIHAMTSQSHMRWSIKGGLAVAASLAIAVLAIIAPFSMEDSSDPYAEAVEDSVFAEASEIFPLVSIVPDSEMVTWSDDGKVLMLSWNRHPERYIPGEPYTLDNGEIWTFTDREILSWYEEEGGDVEDWTLRLEQLIGLPEDSGYTHVSAFWCDPEELIRPAYSTDITKELDASALDGSMLGEHEQWFEGNIIWSYFASAYPWTRLGYTYDWNEDSDEYGLTEFIILPGSEVEVEWTITTDDFLEWLGKGGFDG